MDVTYLDTGNYMIYIAFFNHKRKHKKQKQKQKQKKKNDQPTDPPNFQAKKANKPLFFLGRSASFM